MIRPTISILRETYDASYGLVEGAYGYDVNITVERHLYYDDGLDKLVDTYHSTYVTDDPYDSDDVVDSALQEVFDIVSDKHEDGTVNIIVNTHINALTELLEEEQQRLRDMNTRRNTMIRLKPTETDMTEFWKLRLKPNWRVCSTTVFDLYDTEMILVQNTNTGTVMGLTKSNHYENVSYTDYEEHIDSGALITMHRIRYGLTRSQLAREIHSTKTTIYYWETQNRFPHVKFRRRLNDVLGLQLPE